METKRREQLNLSEEYREKKEKLWKSKDIRNWYLGFMKSFPNGQRGEKDKFFYHSRPWKKAMRHIHFWCVGKTFPKVAECYWSISYSLKDETQGVARLSKALNDVLAKLEFFFPLAKILKTSKWEDVIRECFGKSVQYHGQIKESLVRS